MTPEEYFQAHTLNPDFIKKAFGVEWDADKITIPIYGADKKRLFQRYRNLNSKDKFTADKGSKVSLFCLHKVLNLDSIVYCEGEPDAMRLWQEGIPAVTGTSGVTTITTELVAPLKGKHILLCLDNDKAGFSNIVKANEALEAVGATVHILTFPKNYKDISEYLSDSHTKADFDSLPRLTYSEWEDSRFPDFALMSGAELLTTEYPPHRWLIENVIPVEGFAFFIAAEGCFKTFLTLDMAIALASGTNWLGQELFKVDGPHRVLFIDKENPMEMIQRRIRGLGCTPEAAQNIFWVKFPEKLSVSAGDSNEVSAFMKSLSRKVRDLNIDLIVIDSFIDLMVGSENSAEETQLFIDAIRECFPRKAYATLHHENKPAANVRRNDGQRTRGSTNINAQAQTMFRIELVAKSKTDITIKQTKNRDAEKLDKFLLQAKIEMGEDGKTFVKGFDYMGTAENVGEAETENAEAMIEELFNEEPTLSREDILAEAVERKISQSSADRAIKKMKKDGLIDAIIDPDDPKKTKKLYMFIGKKTEVIEDE